MFRQTPFQRLRSFACLLLHPIHWPKSRVPGWRGPTSSAVGSARSHVSRGHCCLRNLISTRLETNRMMIGPWKTVTLNSKKRHLQTHVKTRKQRCKTPGYTHTPENSGRQAASKEVQRQIGQHKKVSSCNEQKVLETPLSNSLPFPCNILQYYTILFQPVW